MPRQKFIAEKWLEAGAAIDRVPLSPSMPIIQSMNEAGEMVLKARSAHRKRSQLKTKGKYAPLWAVKEAAVAKPS